MTIKIGINGMGRIGRMIVRSIIETQNRNLKIQHINNRSNAEATCKLLKYDSIHGKFKADLQFEEILHQDHVDCSLQYQYHYR